MGTQSAGDPAQRSTTPLDRALCPLPPDERQIAEGDDTWKHYGVRPDWTDLEGYFRAFERARPAINLGTLVGAGGIRDQVVGKENRPATPEELVQMEALVDTAMRQGAFGLSTSLQYVPGRFASTPELVALAKVAAKHGGVYFTHQRSEQREISPSMDEVMTIAREAAIPTNIWHFKTACRENWGRMPEMLARIAAARAGGLDVAANQYPWSAAANSLVAFCTDSPAGATDGKLAETVGTRATYTDPNHYADGIPYVAVNGQLVVDEGKLTAARPGQILRGPGYR